MYGRGRGRRIFYSPNRARLPASRLRTECQKLNPLLVPGTHLFECCNTIANGFHDVDGQDPHYDELWQLYYESDDTGSSDRFLMQKCLSTAMRFLNEPWKHMEAGTVFTDADISDRMGAVPCFGNITHATHRTETVFSSRRDPGKKQIVVAERVIERVEQALPGFFNDATDAGLKKHKICLTGGFLVLALQESPRYREPVIDIDLCIIRDDDYHSKNTTEQRQIVEDAAKFVYETLKKIACEIQVTKSAKVMNFHVTLSPLTLEVQKIVQLNLVPYASVGEYIFSTDVACTSILFDWSRVYFHGLSKFAWEYGLNVPHDKTGATASHAHNFVPRLFKYLDRGFGIFFPYLWRPLASTTFLFGGNMRGILEKDPFVTMETYSSVETSNYLIDKTARNFIVHAEICKFMQIYLGKFNNNNDDDLDALHANTAAQQQQQRQRLEEYQDDEDGEDVDMHNQLYQQDERKEEEFPALSNLTNGPRLSLVQHLAKQALQDLETYFVGNVAFYSRLKNVDCMTSDSLLADVPVSFCKESLAQLLHCSCEGIQTIVGDFLRVFEREVLRTKAIFTTTPDFQLKAIAARNTHRLYSKYPVITTIVTRDPGIRRISVDLADFYGPDLNPLFAPYHNFCGYLDAITTFLAESWTTIERQQQRKKQGQKKSVAWNNTQQNRFEYSCCNLVVIVMTIIIATEELYQFS